MITKILWAIIAFVAASGVSPVFAALPDEHYSIVTVRFYPTRTDTVVDEVWREASSNWRLERRSDHWDNGLVAVSDGKRVFLSVPRVAQTLDVSLSAIRSVVDPGAMYNIHPVHMQAPAGEERVMGKDALLYRSKIGNVNTKLWIDKQSLRPLREERLDKQGRPTMVLVRNELPIVADDTERFKMDTGVMTRVLNEWRTKAINAWVIDQIKAPVKLTSLLPKAVRMVSAERLSGSDGQIVVRLARGSEVISLFLAPAKGDPPSQRRLFDRGLPVQAKRVSNLDVTLVGELSATEADRMFELLEQQLTQKE